MNSQSSNIAETRLLPKKHYDPTCFICGICYVVCNLLHLANVLLPSNNTALDDMSSKSLHDRNALASTHIILLSGICTSCRQQHCENAVFPINDNYVSEKLTALNEMHRSNALAPTR